MDMNDAEARQLAREALDRFMQAGSLRELRDVVAAAPVLLNPFFSDRLGEMANRLRQIGEVSMAEGVEFRQGLLRRFRERGLQEGFLELVINFLIHADTAEEHQRLLAEYPELTDPATSAFIVRRIEELSAAGDTLGVTQHVMAKALIASAEISDLEPKASASLDGAVGAFYSGFVMNADPAVNRRAVEGHPELLKPPASLVLDSMFQPKISEAQAANDLVTMRALVLRRRLFQRCQEVGVDRAFAELAKGVRWPKAGQT
jgi:hypothetical protein